VHRAIRALVTLLALGCAATGTFAQEPASRDERELGGHRFIPSGRLPDPFVTTHARFRTAGGLADGFQAKYNVPVVDTVKTTSGDIAFFGLDFEYQQNLWERTAVRLSLEGNARVGVDNQSLLASGLSSTYGMELEAKYRMLESHNFALSGAVVVRLPTGHQDSPNYLFDISTGDHQTDIELRVAEELTLFNRVWLNGAVRLGRQRPGERERRIGPQDSLLIPVAALARLNWDPGDYAAFDAAPMYRFTRAFAVGFTLGYYTQQRDRYTFRSAQDSIDVATNMGAPLSASVLDAGTAFRWTRLGVAMTYATPEVEGSLSFEQTVTGAGGLVPVASVFRIVMRTTRWPF